VLERPFWFFNIFFPLLMLNNKKSNAGIVNEFE